MYGSDASFLNVPDGLDEARRCFHAPDVGPPHSPDTHAVLPYLVAHWSGHLLPGPVLNHYVRDAIQVHPGLVAPRLARPPARWLWMISVLACAAARDTTRHPRVFAADCAHLAHCAVGLDRAAPLGVQWEPWDDGLAWLEIAGSDAMNVELTHVHGQVLVFCTKGDMYTGVGAYSGEVFAECIHHLIEPAWLVHPEAA